jgi:hypothetical protein
MRQYDTNNLVVHAHLSADPDVVEVTPEDALPVPEGYQSVTVPLVILPIIFKSWLVALNHLLMERIRAILGLRSTIDHAIHGYPIYDVTHPSSRANLGGVPARSSWALSHQIASH